MLPLLLHKVKAEMGEVLSAFEFLDVACLGAIRKTSPHLLRRSAYCSIDCNIRNNCITYLFCIARNNHDNGYYKSIIHSNCHAFLWLAFVQ